MKEKRMCKQRIALDMIMSQNNKGGLSKGAILLHTKQCEDMEDMQKKMSELEKKVDNINKSVDTLKNSVENLDIKIDNLFEKFESSPTFGKVLKSFLENKIVQAIIVSAIATYIGSNHITDLLEFLK